jgi:hypothetical protein
MTLTSIQKNKSLLEENKELRDQILQIRTKDFISRKNNENNTQIINFQNDLIRSLKNNDPLTYKIASIDLRNYLCCSTHRIFLKNTNDVLLDSNLPVFAGGSFIGQTKGTYLNIIEVILFSDTESRLTHKI